MFDRVQKADIEAFLGLILNAILEHKPTGNGPFCLFCFRTLAELKHSFPQMVISSWDPSANLCNFLGEIRLPEGTSLAYDLRKSSEIWWVSVIPAKTWDEGLSAAGAELARPTPGAEFGLSYDAARLYEWIRSLTPKDYLGVWTPVLECCIKSKIGIRAEWPQNKLPALIQMLADEISEKTSLRVTL